MAIKTRSELYFYRDVNYEEKTTHGMRMYRDGSMPVGKWMPLPCAIDRLINHLMIVTGHVKYATLLDVLNIHAASVTRFRDKTDLPLNWLVRMADYSGLSLIELRLIGGLKTSLPHYNEFHTRTLRNVA